MEETKQLIKCKVNHFFKKYFNFFHLPEFVPHKWYKKLKKIIAKYFENKRDLKDLQELKDEEIENFNIDDLINTIISQNAFLDDYLESFKSVESDTKENGNSFNETLDTILKNQNNYNWYNEYNYEKITGKEGK